MRNTLIGRLARTRHFFQSRDAGLSLASVRRGIRHWLRHATARAIEATTADLRFNPYLFLVESDR